MLDWLIAVGLAALLLNLAAMTSAQFLYGDTSRPVATAVWFVLGVVSVRLFGFTPGQYACGLKVVSVDNRAHVGTGRAAARNLLIALVIPALFIDGDGRGIQDRLTATAVVLR